MIGLLLLMALQGDPPSEKTILEWIQQLTSEEIHRRAEATEKLREAGEAARPPLTRALESPDPELRERCKALLARFEMEPGARQLARIGDDVPEIRGDAEQQKEYDRLSSQAKSEVLLKKDYQWVPYAIDGILSDRAVVVEGSLRLLNRIIQKRNIPAERSELAPKLDLRAYRAAQARADEYSYWAQWWHTKAARNLVIEWEKGPSAETEDWEEALRRLRAGWPHGEEKKRFERIKSYGKAAYPHLIQYLDFEDTGVGTTAVRILKELTGRSEGPDRAIETNRAELKSEWATWLKSQR